MNPTKTIQPEQLLRSLFAAAVARAQPLVCMPDHLPAPPKGKTVVVGAGKAGAAMAMALDSLWPRQAPLSGLVVTRYGHLPADFQPEHCRIRVVEAAHPVPDAAGQAAAKAILQLVQGLGPDDLVIALISGGGSALLSLPAPGLSLADKQAVSQALLRSGASIEEMNCLRKHLSAIKGGRLAAACGQTPLVSLLISDVPGDDPSVIASGPTVVDMTTCQDALEICRRHGIELPPAALQGLQSGAYETPKPGVPGWPGHSVRVMATPQQSLEAAAALAEEMGIPAHILGDDLEGESREVGKVHAALARAVARRGQPFAAPCLLLSGGETTVTVRGPAGRGGRATEFLLSTALSLQGEPGVWGLSADTDGIDGVEDCAGALIRPDTLARAQAMGLSAQAALEGHDASAFFERLGDLVITGPTQTNVNDFRALLILPHGE